MLCNLKKFLRTYLFLIVGSAVFIIVSDPTKESKETAFASKSQKNKTNFADATSYRSGIPIEAAPAVKLIFENHRRKRVLSDSDVELKWMLSRIIPLLSIFAESYDEVTHDDSEENTHRTRRDTTFVSSKEKPSYLIKRKGFYDRHDSGYYPKCNRCYNTRNEALPLLSLGLLAFFLFYFVVVLASTTSTTSTTAAPVAVVPAKKVTNKLFTPIDGQYDNHFAQDGRPFVFHFHFLPVPQGTTGYNSLQPTTGSPINKIKETSQTYSTARPTTTTEYVTTRITTTKSVITEAPIQTAPPRTTTVKRPFYQSTKAHNTKIQIRANASVHGQLPNHSPAVVFQMPNIMPMYHPQMVPFESLFKPLSTTKPQMEPITYRNPNPFLSNAFAGNDGMKLGLNSNNTMTLVLNRPFHQLPYHNPIFQHIINSQLKATPTPAIPTTTTKASNDRPPKIPIHIVIKELHKNSPVNTKNKATPPSKPSYPEQVTKLTNLASDGSYYDYITDLIKRVGRSMVSKKFYGKFMHEKPRSINRPEGDQVVDVQTWLSLIGDVWNSHKKNPSSREQCTMRALCRMNRLAAESSHFTAKVVALSSLPLGSLLHHRQNGGFWDYLSAAIDGLNERDCYYIYKC